MVSVPFKSQLGAGADKHNKDCLIASLAMMRGAYGFTVENPDDIYKRLGIVEDNYLSASIAKNDLEREGILCDFKTNSNLDSLKAILDGGIPVIALVSYKPLVAARLTENKTFMGAHFVVVTDVTDTSVTYHDPYMVKGANIVATRATFLAAWDEVGKNPDFPNPSRGMLVPRITPAAFREQQAAGGPADQYAVVTASGLNMRTAPWGSIIRVLPKDFQVKVERVDGDWTRISYPSTGYVYTSYLRMLPASEPPVTVDVHRLGRKAVDISHWNGFVSMALLAESVDFVYMKATDGYGKFVDDHFLANYAAAKIAKLPAVPYHFYWPLTDVELQFRMLSRASGEWGSPYPAVIDFEPYIFAASDYGKSNGVPVPEATDKVATDLLKLAELITAAAGSKPAVYISGQDFTRYFKGDYRLFDYDIIFPFYPSYTGGAAYADYWRVENYTTKVPIVPSGMTLQQIKFWQFTDKGKVLGVSGNVDMNIEIIT